MDAYLDIETTGLSPYYHQVTVVGISTGEGASHHLTQLIGSEITVGNITDSIQGAETLYTYNGRKFDLPFLKKSLGIDLERGCYHCDLMYDCWSRNLFGGLKAVERRLGIRRKFPDINGYEAVRLWRRYLSTHDLNALRLLLEYNKEDVLNLRTLRTHLALR
jgi:uncharacterized protein